MDGDWTAVAAAVTERLKQMRAWGNLSEVSRQSGVSDATWRNLLRGQPVTRADRVILICDYLGWTLDSIEHILGGGRPDLAEPADDEEGPTGLEQLRQEVKQIRRDLTDVRGRIEGMNLVMTKLERQLSPRPRRGRRAGGSAGQ